MNTTMRARWDDLARIVDQALDLELADRPVFVEQACSGDPVLRGEVERLLTATERAADFLDQPVATDVAPIVSWVARQESQALAAGTRFGAYEVTGLLGRGGMATVYLAEDHKHHRTVAVKVFDAAVGAAIGREWFLREIQVAAGLHHPHILPLYDSGDVDGRLYYVMPHVEGESLRQRLSREGRIPLASARRMVQEVAGALDYAHRKGVVHRDIKPENILLQEGQAVVADFGIARAIAAEVPGGGTVDTIPAIGTPAYMSPEQGAGARAIDGRTDVYALGCVLYEMLASGPPFTGPTVQSILEQHAMVPAPSLSLARPDVPPGVAHAIARALQKSPADRFPTAGDLVEALDRAARAPSDAPVESRVSRRALVALAVALLISVFGAVIARPSRSRLLNPRLVAVLPFRADGASAELAWLREGIVDLLAIRLSGEGGLRLASPRTVLGAWRRAGGTDARDVAPEAALGIAHQVGAGQVIDGSVVGTAAHLTLTASLLVGNGRTGLAATVDGPADSLPALVDRLAGRLLGLSAGTEGSRLSSLTSTSLPAIRAYLAGRATFRAGHPDEALRYFRQATLLDSTFALAALELLHVAIWVPARHGVDMERGKRLALAGRDRLSPADQTLLEDWAGSPPTATELFERRVAATSAYPDLPETWYALGDSYFHHGISAGLEDPMRLAAGAFERGLRIDSVNASVSLSPERSTIFVEPLTHMVDIAQLEGDTGAVRRLALLGLAADSAPTSNPYLRWNLAVLLGDSARRAFWTSWAGMIESGAAPPVPITIEWTGPAPQSYLRAVDADYQQAAALAIRHDQIGDPAAAAFGRGVRALNGGRPDEARRFLFGDDTSASKLRERVLDALYWGADTAEASDAARQLTHDTKFVALDGDVTQIQIANHCVLATWRAAHGDYQYAEIASQRLRNAHVTGLGANDSITVGWYTAMCAMLLDATRATALHLPNARAKLLQADAAARSFIFVVSLAPNLVVARLAELQGDRPLALRALRRRAGGYGVFPSYFSTFLREEGRLAALTGDTPGAIRAYGHYLALHTDPEPIARGEVDLVRSRLASLMTIVH